VEVFRRACSFWLELTKDILKHRLTNRRAVLSTVFIGDQQRDQRGPQSRHRNGKGDEALTARRCCNPSVFKFSIEQFQDSDSCIDAT